MMAKKMQMRIGNMALGQIDRMNDAMKVAAPGTQVQAATHAVGTGYQEMIQEINKNAVKKSRITPVGTFFPAGFRSAIDPRAQGPGGAGRGLGAVMLGRTAGMLTQFALITGAITLLTVGINELTKIIKFAKRKDVDYETAIGLSSEATTAFAGLYLELESTSEQAKKTDSYKKLRTEMGDSADEVENFSKVLKEFSKDMPRSEQVSIVAEAMGRIPTAIRELTDQDIISKDGLRTLSQFRQILEKIGFEGINSNLEARNLQIQMLTFLQNEILKNFEISINHVKTSIGALRDDAEKLDFTGGFDFAIGSVFDKNRANRVIIDFYDAIQEQFFQFDYEGYGEKDIASKVLQQLTPKAPRFETIADALAEALYRDGEFRQDAYDELVKAIQRETMPSLKALEKQTALGLFAIPTDQLSIPERATKDFFRAIDEALAKSVKNIRGQVPEQYRELFNILSIDLTDDFEAFIERVSSIGRMLAKMTEPLFDVVNNYGKQLATLDIQEGLSRQFGFGVYTPEKRQKALQDFVMSVGGVYAELEAETRKLREQRDLLASLKETDLVKTLAEANRATKAKLLVSGKAMMTPEEFQKFEPQIGGLIEEEAALEKRLDDLEAQILMQKEIYKNIAGRLLDNNEVLFGWVDTLKAAGIDMSVTSFKAMIKKVADGNTEAIKRFYTVMTTALKISRDIVISNAVAMEQITDQSEIAKLMAGARRGIYGAAYAGLIQIEEELRLREQEIDAQQRMLDFRKSIDKIADDEYSITSNKLQLEKRRLQIEARNNRAIEQINTAREKALILSQEQLETIRIQLDSVGEYQALAAPGIGMAEVRRQNQLTEQISKAKLKAEQDDLERRKRLSAIGEEQYAIEKSRLISQERTTELSNELNAALAEFAYVANQLHGTTQEARDVFIGVLSDLDAIQEGAFGEVGAKPLVIEDMLKNLFSIRTQNLSQQLIEQIFPGDILGAILGGRSEPLSPEAEKQIAELARNSQAIDGLVVTEQSLEDTIVGVETVFKELIQSNHQLETANEKLTSAILNAELVPPEITVALDPSSTASIAEDNGLIQSNQNLESSIDNLALVIQDKTTAIEGLPRIDTDYPYWQAPTLIPGTGAGGASGTAGTTEGFTPGGGRFGGHGATGTWEDIAATSAAVVTAYQALAQTNTAVASSSEQVATTNQELTPTVGTLIDAVSINSRLTRQLNMTLAVIPETGVIPPAPESVTGDILKAQESKWLPLLGMIGQLGGTFIGGQVAQANQKTGQYVGIGSGFLSTAFGLWNPLLAPLGGILGGILGGLLSPDKANDLLDDIEENTRIIADNTNNLPSVDPRLINAPANFTLPALATAGGNRIDQLNININGSDSNPIEIANEVMGRLNKEFDTGHSSYNLVSGGVK
jgi:hypothetical protein